MEVRFFIKKEGKMIKKIIITATIITTIGITATGYNYQETKHLSTISSNGSTCSRKGDPVNNGSARIGGGSKVVESGGEISTCSRKGDPVNNGSALLGGGYSK